MAHGHFNPLASLLVTGVAVAVVATSVAVCWVSRVDGYWADPRPGYVYVDGYYDDGNHGYVWRSGSSVDRANGVMVTPRGR